MKFSEHLKNLRKEKNMTQVELSEKTGITSRQIQKYESGAARPRLEQAQKIAEVLDVSVDELLGKQGLAVAELGEKDGAKPTANAFAAYALFCGNVLYLFLERTAIYA